MIREINKNSKIMVLGHTGLIGSALLKELHLQNYANVIIVSRGIIDLTDYKSTLSAFMYHKPDCIINAAGKTGGIYANSTRGGDFLRENLQISTNVIEASRKSGVGKLLFLASGYVYPYASNNPVNESQLFSGIPEESNIGHAVAEMTAIKMCQLYCKQYDCDYVPIISPNVYGECDNFDEVNSRVIPGMIVKIQKAKLNHDKQVTLWGDGTPMREFIYAKDLSKAAIFLMRNHKDSSMINVGSGAEISMYDLAIMIKNIIGYTGEISWNPNHKNGSLRRVLDAKRINAMGWHAETDLSEGIKNTYDWYKLNYYNLRKK